MRWARELREQLRLEPAHVAQVRVRVRGRIRVARVRVRVWGRVRLRGQG
jgi:hypothetical protein